MLVRKRTALLFLGLAASALAACATAPKVEIDRLAGADLASHDTFALLPERSAGVDDPAFGPTAKAAAEQALVAELRARGLRRVEPDEAALLASVGATSRTRLEPVGTTVAWTRPHVHRSTTGVRTPVGDVPLSQRTVVHPGTSYAVSGPTGEATQRTVVVDLVEAESGKLVWRGTSTDRRARRSIDPDDLRERVRAIVGEFP